jgi:hypothetical protein
MTPAKLIYTAKAGKRQCVKKNINDKNFKNLLKKKIEKQPSDKELDSKIEQLVSLTKNNAYSSVDVSYIRRPNLGAFKASKNKQPSQVSGFYKKPSLMSNFSLNLEKSNSIVLIPRTAVKSNSVMVKSAAKVHINHTRNSKRFAYNSDSKTERPTKRSSKVNHSFKSDTTRKVKPCRSILKADRSSTDFKTPDVMSVTGKFPIFLEYRFLLRESFKRQILKWAPHEIKEK